MLVATVINFLLSNLYTGSQVTTFLLSICKALILDIDHPLLERPEVLNNALRNVHTVFDWAVSLSVSINLSLPDPAFIHAWWRCWSAISLSFGGLGPSLQIDSGQSSYRSFCGSQPWVNRHFPGSCSLLLNLYTPGDHPNMDIDPQGLRSIELESRPFSNGSKLYALNGNKRRHDNDDCVSIVVCRCGQDPFDQVA